MITKPSIADLLEGVTLTLERVVLPDPAASGDVLTELLGVIDRVAGEWPSTSATSPKTTPTSGPR